MWREGLPPRYHHKKLPVHDKEKTVPVVVQYPTGFDVAIGVGQRVAFLNKDLLRHYDFLGQMIRYRHANILAYNKAFDRDPEFFPLKEYILDRMYSDISDASSSIENTVHTIIYLIGEIDAVAGPEAFYIPQEFKGYLGPLRFLVPSKSLQYLAESPHYVEEYYVKPGERDSYAFLAYCVNKIKYFVACHCEEMVKEPMKSCYFSLSPDRIESMPPQLRDEVQKMVSHMWSRKKEEALKKMNDESSESILCLSDTKLKTLEREFMQQDEVNSEKSRKEFVNELDEGSKKRSRNDEGQDEQLKKLEEETDRVMQKKHAKEKPNMQKEQQLKKVVEEDKGAKEKEQDKGKYQMHKEQQLKKVVEEKDKEAKEKKQDMEKCQMHKFKLVGDPYTEDAMDNLGEDEDDECYDDDYPYDTDDSNAEDNPLYDYPDEET